jgi:hypothetical protein
MRNPVLVIIRAAGAKLFQELVDPPAPIRGRVPLCTRLWVPMLRCPAPPSLSPGSRRRYTMRPDAMPFGAIPFDKTLNRQVAHLRNMLASLTAGRENLNRALGIVTSRQVSTNSSRRQQRQVRVRR